MSIESPAPPNKTKLMVGQVVGGVVGIAAGSYSGMNLLIPGVAALAIWLVGSKLVHPQDPRYLGAITALGAQLIWLLAGMALLGAWGPNLVDLFLIGGGLAWLWARPSLAPVIYLTVVQLAALAINVSAIVGHSVGNPEHRALVVHIALRILGVGAMWYAYYQGRRNRGEA